MDHNYSVFGLRLNSNLKIPGLTILDSTDLPADVKVHLETAPSASERPPGDPDGPLYVSAYSADDGEPVLRIWEVANGTILRLDYFDGVQFWMDRKGENVWAIWPGTLRIEDATSYLLGPVLGLLLRFRGLTCLHASAVTFGNCAVAFVGSEGAGKSTTAAALARNGHPVLSDDIVALTNRGGVFHVSPAYPQLWLWPDSVEAIFGSTEAIACFTPNYDKRCVNLGSDAFRFEDRFLPLKTIYLLGERKDDPAPCIETLPRQEALVTLVANTYATNILDRDLRAREFEVLGQIISSVPIRRIHAHRDARRLDELCQLIAEDLSLVQPFQIP
jgi:hypothetical protein